MRPGRLGACSARSNESGRFRPAEQAGWGRGSTWAPGQRFLTPPPPPARLSSALGLRRAAVNTHPAESPRAAPVRSRGADQRRAHRGDDGLGNGIYHCSTVMGNGALRCPRGVTGVGMYHSRKGEPGVGVSH